MTATTTSRNVPAEALMFRSAGPLSFAAGGDAQRVPVTMLARTPDPIDSAYWGPIVHDLAGMFLLKPTLPIDYCHESRFSIDALIGAATEFRTDERIGLTIGGELVSTRPDDTAAAIIAKGRGGIPFEASIDWNGPGIVLEEIGEGASAEVNGRTFYGPGVIVRNWPLRSAAVCPFGLDAGTAAKFSERGERSERAAGDVAVEFLAAPEPPAIDGPPAIDEDEQRRLLAALYIPPPATTEPPAARRKQFKDVFRIRCLRDRPSTPGQR